MLRERQRVLSIVMLFCLIISTTSMFAFSNNVNGGLVEKPKSADLKLREKGQEIVERNVPIVMFGIDWKKGCLEVVLREVEQDYVEIIKTVVGNIPVEFYKGKLYLDIDKTQKFRPTKGGIRVQTHVHPYVYSHTLGFAARRTDGALGIVITGHAGGVGTHVYQPVVASLDFVGSITLNPLTNRWSDSAWVPLNNTCGHIYYNRTIIGTRTLAVGQPVAMEGATSCGTSGHVHIVNYTIYDPGRGIYIYNQVVATYSSQLGDSGGPVTHLGPEPNQVYLCGIHVGRVTIAGVSYAVYSPWEGVRSDLGLLEPLVTQVVSPGYCWKEISYRWVSRVSTTPIAVGDDVGVWVSLAWSFPFFGEGRSRVYVCSNGFLIFDPTPATTDYSNSLAKLKIRCKIATFWDDLRTDVAGGIVSTPGVYVDSYADGVVITWEATRYGASADSIVFQTVLFRNGSVWISINGATNFANFSPTIGVSKGDSRSWYDVTPKSGTSKTWLLVYDHGCFMWERPGGYEAPAGYANADAGLSSAETMPRTIGVLTGAQTTSGPT